MRPRSLLALAIFAFFAAPAWAHDPGLSSASLTVGPQQIVAIAVFNPADLAAAGISDPSRYAALAAEILQVRIGGALATPKLLGVEKDASANVTFRLSYAGSLTDPIEISSGIIERLPFGHRQMVRVRSDTGVSLGDRLLSARENRLTFLLPEKAAPAAGLRLTDFFLLGVRHIVTGYDHLLFLFGLLVVCRNVRGALLLITCFTLAHSLTLALATFGLVNLQGRLVEPAIAASIIYVGVENLSRGGASLSSRWILTFMFGLIHGLGFATVLRELGVSGSAASAAVPLFGFNLGVEAGQLSIAAIVLPIIWKLRQRALFLKVGIPAFSLVIALAGGYWLLERTVLT